MTQNTNKANRHANKHGNKNFYEGQNRRNRSIEDYIFYLGTNKQASDYEVSSEFILNYIKRTFERGNNIAESLRTLTKLDTKSWRPKLQTSKAKNATIRETENKQYNMKKIYTNHTRFSGRNAQKGCKIKLHHKRL